MKFGLNQLKFYNKIRNLATSKIMSLAAGEVEIKGTVTANKQPLISPVTNTKCASYSLKAYRWVQGRKSGSWSLMYQKSVSRPFYVSDDTGFILVDPEGAKIRNDTFSSVQQNGMLPSLTNINKSKNTEKFTGFLKKLVSGSRYKFDEICIPEGEQIYIMGYTKENPNRPNNAKVQGLMIAKKENKDYLITDEKENDLKGVYIQTAATVFIIGGFLVIFGLLQIFNILDWISFIGDF
ncbi:E3 ubiquitin ligase family protein [Candidatus Woesearchaeota archaeon]|nr:E3 ubiquitin ligase family protein [Candidatus Woesearchaeota archaeon]